MKPLAMKKFSQYSFLALGLVATAMLSCSGNSGNGQNPAPPVQQGTTSTVRTTLSDPPTCKGPGKHGEVTFEHVWVTVTLVRAHISSTAEDQDGGWVTLADLRDHPKQVDLFSQADTQCVLTVLGSTTGLAPGKYQQIRLHLLSNSPGSGEAVPSPNACESAGSFNCAQLSSDDIRTLQLSSEDKTGIKIPPGQIGGGGITLTAGKAADIDIDFNACRSIVIQGNGKLRLKPTLHIGEVSVADAISGRFVVNGTNTTLPGPATTVVFGEQKDQDGIDRVILETLAEPAEGTFIFCPLPQGSYDIVAAAIDANGATYNATILFSVPSGTAIGDIPLVPEAGPNTSPGTIQGMVTSAGAGGAVAIDGSLSALQMARPEGGVDTPVTIPLLDTATPTFSTSPNASCPTGADCATYNLSVPASNPQVGTFKSSGTTYSGPAEGSVPYSVNARAFNGSQPDCSPSGLITDKNDTAGPLEVTAGGTVTAETLDFTGCTQATSE